MNFVFQVDSVADSSPLKLVELVTFLLHLKVQMDDIWRSRHCPVGNRFWSSSSWVIRSELVLHNQVIFKDLPHIKYVLKF